MKFIIFFRNMKYFVAESHVRAMSVLKPCGVFILRMIYIRIELNSYGSLKQKWLIIQVKKNEKFNNFQNFIRKDVDFSSLQLRRMDLSEIGDIFP